MATRGQELNTRITADDQASKIVDQVASKMAGLEDKPTDIVLSAEDQATRKVEKLEARLKDMKAEDVEVVLQARADQLDREIDRAVKKLAAAKDYDGDEIAMIMRVKDQATAELAQIRSKLDSIKPVEVPVEVEEPSSGLLSGLQGTMDGIGGQLGGKLAGGLAAGFGAAAVGAVLVESLNRSWDQAAGLRTITAQFRLSQDEMAEYGGAASRVYAENWGESLRDVQQVVATTAQRLTDVTGGELEKISAQVIAVSDTWGKDYTEILRSVTQLTQNGLAKSSQEALDLIVSAFQAGGDEAGDLLDTIDEYSQHWAALGFSGEEAMNQVVTAIQSGQRDTDKLADAVKEFRLRAVEDIDATGSAYGELGLDADKLRQDILRGGDDAKRAFLTTIEAIKGVEDPVDRNRLAVQFLGTQFEDLGPQALDVLLSIEGALGDVEGAAQDVADTVGEASPWDRMQRVGERALTGIGMALDEKVAKPLDDAARGAEWLGDKIAGIGDGPPEMIDLVATAIDGVTAAYEKALDGAARGEGAADRYAESLVDLSEAAGTAESNSEALAEMHEEEARKAEAAANAHDVKRRAMEKELAAAEDLETQILRNIGGEDAVRRAVMNTEDAIVNLTEVMGNSESTMRDVEEAQLDVKDAARAQAEAAVRYAEDQAAANGVTLDARDKAAIYRDELQSVADQLDGPMRDAILGFIAELDKIPTSKTVQIRLEGGGTATVDPDGRKRGQRHVGGLFAAGDRITVLPGEEIEMSMRGPGRVYSQEDVARERQQMVSGRRSRSGRAVSFAGATFIGTPDPRYLQQWARQMERELRGRR